MVHQTSKPTIAVAAADLPLDVEAKMKNKRTSQFESLSENLRR